MTQKLILRAPVFLAAFLFVSCHSLTTAVRGGNPPQFSFSSGRFAECCTTLTFLGVYEVPPENIEAAWSQRPKDDVVLWQIWPAPTTNNEANALPTVTYGSVPPGFVQKVPTSGSPPPLVEGKVYEVGGPAVDVPHSYIRFIIRNGKATEVPIPGKW